MSKSLVIFHFRPIEHYPPVQNFIAAFCDKETTYRLTCFSTQGKMSPLVYNRQVIKLFRFGGMSSNKLMLWYTYLYYNLAALSYLIIKRPCHVLYYETLSAFPATIYKRFINSKVKIYVHYHEYTSPVEYEKASPVERYIHRLEKKNYTRVEWISHTNEVRLEKFLSDEKINYDPKIHHSLPNYPTKKWAIPNQKWWEGKLLNLVYAGYSLTEKGSYLKEVVHFLANAKIPSKLSIYCLQTNDFMIQLAGKHANLTVVVNDGLAYNDLPNILSQQHIGLILYKAITPNYIYNAPNKLFEYLSCGLDVWYPSEMKGIYEYDSSSTPKVIRLDFANLSTVKLEKMIENQTQNLSREYCAEEVYSKLIDQMR